jgi:hypothetical protein
LDYELGYIWFRATNDLLSHRDHALWQEPRVQAIDDGGDPKKAKIVVNPRFDT